MLVTAHLRQHHQALSPVQVPISKVLLLEEVLLGSPRSGLLTDRWTCHPVECHHLGLDYLSKMLMVLISNSPEIMLVHRLKDVKVRRRCLGGYLLNSHPAVIPLEVLSEMVLFEGLQTLQMFIRSIIILKQQPPPIPLTCHWKTYMRGSLVITRRLSLMAHQG